MEHCHPHDQIFRWIFSILWTSVDKSLLCVAWEALWLSTFKFNRRLITYTLSFTFSDASMSLGKNYPVLLYKSPFRFPVHSCTLSAMRSSWVNAIYHYSNSKNVLIFFHALKKQAVCIIFVSFLPSKFSISHCSKSASHFKRLFTYPVFLNKW